jgi:hypothetical protein
MVFMSLLLGFLTIVGGCFNGATDSAPEESVDLGVLAGFEKARSVEIYALHPSPYDPEGKPVGTEDDFRSYKILGRADLPLDELPQLLGLLAEGIAANTGMVAACFNPRHGVRLDHGDHTVDLVICFECLQIYQYDSLSDDRVTHLTVSRVAGPVNVLYQRHGLTIHGQ